VPPCTGLFEIGPFGVAPSNNTVRVDNDTELEYMRHGGVLSMVLRHLMAE
jgi:aconitase A